MNEAFEYINQEFNEKRFNRKHIDGYIREWIEGDAYIQTKIKEGVILIQEYMSKDYYKSKNIRINQLKQIELEPLVIDILVGIAYHLREELFTSVTAQMASRLGFSDRTEAIVTVAELVAVLCQTDLFDILKASRAASLVLVSRMPLPEKLVRHIEDSKFLPPMVCKPLQLDSNYSSGYLTHTDSLILGSGNHHDGDICLDVLNKMNGVALKLDLEFLCKVEEMPTFEIENQEQYDQWKNFKVDSYRMYDLIQSQSNKFYLTHKVDKRGRIYAQGYHISTQGSAFKKAMIELYNQELVEGVS